ncbi:hypothetical protein BX600DRAFT_13913 [Xylariales sp. PMI_506]|nr:hypothetical protein BX600DRAFT_13913 [Xylariales sp. PMI_506]
MPPLQATPQTNIHDLISPLPGSPIGSFPGLLAQEVQMPPRRKSRSTEQPPPPRQEIEADDASEGQPGNILALTQTPKKPQSPSGSETPPMRNVSPVPQIITCIAQEPEPTEGENSELQKAMEKKKIKDDKARWKREKNKADKEERQRKKAERKAEERERREREKEKKRRKTEERSKARGDQKRRKEFRFSPPPLPYGFREPSAIAPSCNSRSQHEYHLQHQQPANPPLRHDEERRKVEFLEDMRRKLELGLASLPSLDHLADHFHKIMPMSSVQESPCVRGSTSNEEPQANANVCPAHQLLEDIERLGDQLGQHIKEHVEDIPATGDRQKDSSIGEVKISTA